MSSNTIINCWVHSGLVERNRDTPQVEPPRNPTNEDELLLSRVYSDLDVDPELQMTVQEFVNIDKDILTSQDVSDVNIIESVISDMSEDSQTDHDDDIEEVQPTCKQVTDSLNIAIKFFEMESSTVESDMAKLFYFKALIKKLQAKRQNKYHWMTFSRNSNYMYRHNIVFMPRETKQLYVNIYPNLFIY